MGGGIALALAELEVEGCVARGVGGDGAEGLTRGDVLTVANADGGEVAIDGVVTAVAHNDDVGAADVGYGRDFAVEDAAGLGTAMACEVDALAVERDARETFDVVLTVATRDGVGASDGDRQATAVGAEVRRNCAVGVAVVLVARCGGALLGLRFGLGCGL